MDAAALLGAGMDALVLMAGDILPTPPPASLTLPQKTGMESEPPRAPSIALGDRCLPPDEQQRAIMRGFNCQGSSPMSITDLLAQVHHFCPLSTGVYLATALYIHRLAITERAIVVTGRNVHRLLISALTVAMKALEDIRHSHRRFAEACGVSKLELLRLELGFCFLTDFTLMVTRTSLTKQWRLLRDGGEAWARGGSFS